MTGRPLQRYRTCVQWCTNNICTLRRVDHIGWPPPGRRVSDTPCTSRLVCYLTQAYSLHVQAAVDRRLRRLQDDAGRCLELST